MTGKDLILYILNNNLEDKTVFDNGKFLFLFTVEEAALCLEASIATVKALYEMGRLDGVKIGDKIYIYLSPFNR